MTQQTFSAEDANIDHLEPVNVTMPESYYLVRFTWNVALAYQNVRFDLRRNDKSGKILLTVFSEWCREPRDRPKDMALAPGMTAEVPEDIAAMVYDMWVNALFEVRYDRSSNGTLDGWEDIFSAYVRGKGWLHGEADTPTQELPPKWMEDSAKALLQFAKDKDAETCRRRINELRGKLFDYLAKKDSVRVEAKAPH